jgi:hypothetical membrane protein
MSERDRRVWLAWGVIGGILIFNIGWILAEALQGGGYSIARDDVSDLGALTARDPWVLLAATGIAGALTILFALFALRPALAVPGRRAALGAWLLAASLMGLDNLSDTFFRLDCRAMDAGCTSAVSTASWHGTVHVIVATVAAFATIAAPFVLAPRMRRVEGWRDLATPTIAIGVLFVVVVLGYAALERKSGGGYLQRAAIVILSAGVIALALRVRALSTRSSAHEERLRVPTP